MNTPRFSAPAIHWRYCNRTDGFTVLTACRRVTDEDRASVILSDITCPDCLRVLAALEADERRAEGPPCDLGVVLSSMQGATNCLRESAKQHRLRGDGAGHGQMCERHASQLLSRCAELRHHIERTRTDTDGHVRG